MIEIKSDKEIKLMEEACKLAYLTHKEIEKNLKVRNIYL